MRTYSITAAFIAVTVAGLTACGDVADPNSLNSAQGGTSSLGGTSGTAGVGVGGNAMGGTAGTGVGGSMGGAAGTGVGGTPPAVGGMGGSMGGMAGTGMGGDAGTTGVGAMGGMGGMAGTPGVGAMGGMGGTTSTCEGPYCPREGSFRMLVYSQVIGTAFPHPSIPAGRRMLEDIGMKQGFEVTIAQDESEINPAGLANYEIVFHMNSTGEIFNQGNQRADYEAWMRAGGAFAGMHGATDSAQSWQFYKEITGQYYNGHNPAGSSGTIQWTEDGRNHFVGQNLPDPWQRNEEWYKFDSWADWSTGAGFTILSTVNTNDGGTRPVSYVREWSNFRAFYTSLGHDDGPYSDPDVIKHVTQGIMWAVRREALIVP